MQEILSATALSLFDPADRSASVNGSAVDILAYEGQSAAILQSSAGTGTNPTLDVKLQDSADGSTGWADIAGAAFTQVTNAAPAAQIVKFNASNARRYVRAVVTIGGTTPSFLCAVSFVGKKQIVP
ncbi:MAG: hypothetical protein OHK0028_23650 [Deltaproteobacteria bacterium]